MVGDGGSTTDSRLAAARFRAVDPHGWRLLYTRGYSLAAPPDFARDWLVRHLPFQDLARIDHAVVVLSREPLPAVRVSFRKLNLDRITEWDLSRPDLILATDSLWKRERLELLGREEHRFMGNANGSIVELTRRLKPISLVSRVGHALFPMTSRGPVDLEAATFTQLDRDFCRA
jgi:hypothetical protein